MCFCFVQLSTSSWYLQILGVKKQWSRHLHKVSVSHHAPSEGTIHVMVISFSGIQKHKVMSISSWRAIYILYLHEPHEYHLWSTSSPRNDILRSSKSGVGQVTWIWLSLGSNFTGSAEIQPSCWARCRQTIHILKCFIHRKTEIAKPAHISYLFGVSFAKHPRTLITLSSFPSLRRSDLTFSAEIFQIIVVCSVQMTAL